jgi:hypothetical protein
VAIRAVTLVGLLLAASFPTRAQEAIATARFIRETPHDVFIELVQIVGKAETVLARTALLPDRVTTIDVIKSPEHWLRISRDERTPLLVASADALSGDIWHVPDVPVTRPLLIWSTAGSIERPTHGAAIITADPAACREAEVLAIRYPSFNRATSYNDLWTTNDLTRCRWVVAGVIGAHEATLRGARGFAGTRSFSPRPRETVSILVSPPTVLVTGIVTINGTPPQNATLTIVRPALHVPVPLRTDGTFEAALDLPGSYQIVLSIPNTRIKPTSRTFSIGSNELIWDISDKAAGTRVTVRVKGHDKSAPVDIEIRQNDNLTLDVIAAGSDTGEWRGHEFGTHRIIARQADATSDWQEFQLSADQPTATVDLALTRSARTLTLRYPDGEPVISAGFVSNTMVRPAEIAPGTYSLASIPEGTRLVIRPPSGAPLCKVVPPAGDVTSISSRGRAVTLRFEGRNIGTNEIEIAPEGSDCPVPLDRFLKSPVRHEADGTTHLEILNAPADDVLMIHLREGLYRMIVPGDGIVVIPSKQ